MALSHDALARSLADHLRGPERMVWCDLQLGRSGSPRPDVYTIFKSFMRPQPMAYECKVSTADFRADVTAGKWQSYLTYASGVYFACEAGLVLKGDVPEHCGLIVLKDGNWRAAKKPVLRPVTVPQDAMLKLLIDGVEREGPVYRRRCWSESEVTLRLEKKYGEVAARTVRDHMAVQRETEYDRHAAQRIIERANNEAEAIRAEATECIEPLRRELCDVMGLPASASKWELEHAVRRLRAAIAEHPAQQQHRRMTESLQRILERDGFKAIAVEQEQEV